MPAMQFARPVAASAVTRTCVQRTRKEKRNFFLQYFFIFFCNYLMLKSGHLLSRIVCYPFSFLCIFPCEGLYIALVPDTVNKAQFT
jgi:hypothetical protein